MEVKNYFLTLKRHWFMLITVPVIAMGAAYFFVKVVPEKYVAKTQIVTGLVDQSQQVINAENHREVNYNNEFTNLIESMQLDKVMNQVSYRLILHDLTEKAPFRKHVFERAGLKANAIRPMVALLQQKQQFFELLNPAVPLEKNIDSLISLAGYDPATLLKKNLKISHTDGSDFINIECETENAELSAFVVNQLSAQFINYYTSNINQGRNKSTEFLKDLLNEKQAAMRQKIAILENYKIKHNILDMASASKDAYDQLNSLQGYRQQADKDVIAYTGALKSIDERFDPKDRKYLESTAVKVNGAILTTRERLRVLNNKYLESNFDPKYKKSLDSLQTALADQINQSTDKYISNPLAAKDNLVQEKLKMENNLELARYSSTSLDRQIGLLNSRLNGLVPAQAVLSSMERDIDIATKEYLDIQDKYNQANVTNIIPVQLRQLHAALPGSKQPSKKILLIALSGCVSFILCMVIILALFYFDNHVRNSEDLERLTQISVLGELNLVPEALAKPKLKHQKYVSSSIQLFRNLLRNIRFEIDRAVEDQKTIAVTSLNATQGKTLLSFSLAYAYAITNKKVLLIDGNFNHPVISNTAKPKLFIEDYLQDAHFNNNQFDAMAPDKLDTGKQTHLLEMGVKTTIGATIQRLNEQASFVPDSMDHINIMGNKGSDISLLEISAQSNIKQKLDDLKTIFDVIIIETGSLDTLSKSKEWMLFADHTLAVFENNQSIKNADKASLQYLRSLNGKMLGWVLNKAVISQRIDTSKLI
jgi:succinoglycan biosynthesis transport protein ExoP